MSSISSMCKYFLKIVWLNSFFIVDAQYSFNNFYIWKIKYSFFESLLSFSQHSDFTQKNYNIFLINILIVKTLVYFDLLLKFFCNTRDDFLFLWYTFLNCLLINLPYHYLLYIFYTFLHLMYLSLNLWFFKFFLLVKVSQYLPNWIYQTFALHPSQYLHMNFSFFIYIIKLSLLK